MLGTGKFQTTMKSPSRRHHAPAVTVQLSSSPKTHHCRANCLRPHLPKPPREAANAAACWSDSHVTKDQSQEAHFRSPRHQRSPFISSSSTTSFWLSLGFVFLCPWKHSLAEYASRSGVPGRGRWRPLRLTKECEIMPMMPRQSRPSFRRPRHRKS